jgi:hypothetical protein
MRKEPVFSQFRVILASVKHGVSLTGEQGQNSGF